MRVAPLLIGSSTGATLTPFLSQTRRGCSDYVLEKFVQANKVNNINCRLLHLDYKRSNSSSSRDASQSIEGKLIIGSSSWAIVIYRLRQQDIVWSHGESVSLALHLHFCRCQGSRGSWVIGLYICRHKTIAHSIDKLDPQTSSNFHKLTVTFLPSEKVRLIFYRFLVDIIIVWRTTDICKEMRICDFSR